MLAITETHTPQMIIVDLRDSVTARSHPAFATASLGRARYGWYERVMRPRVGKSGAGEPVKSFNVREEEEYMEENQRIASEKTCLFCLVLSEVVVAVATTESH